MNLEQALLKTLKQHNIGGDIKNYQIIDAIYKESGISRNVIAGYYKNSRSYPLSRLVKCVWIYRFFASQKKIKSKQGLMYAILKDKLPFPLPDYFWSWYKGQISNPKKTDYEVLYNNI